MKNISNNYITIIDIGTSKIVCLIAKYTIGGNMTIIGIGHQVSGGIRSGIITDIKLAEESIRAAVGAAEDMAGINIDRAIVGISGNKQKSGILKVELNIKGPAISDRDIKQIIEQGSSRFYESGQDVIHCLAVDYTIDGTSGITNPVGMFANKLEATLHIITVASSNIINLNNCMAMCHLNIDGYISTSYASAIACLSEDEKNLGVTSINFGAGNTAISIFKNGNMVYSDNIPIGGGHITNDIAVGLSTSIKSAERVKVLHGNAFKSAKDEHELIDLPSLEEDFAGVQNIQKSSLISIIRPRVEEILELIDNSFNNYGKNKTGGKIVITGGAMQLRGLSDRIEQSFNKTVRIGIPADIDGMAESTKGPSFSTAIGMLLLAKQQLDLKYKIYNGKILSKGIFARTINWMRNNF
jgi:cell division protein FtsA